MLGVYSYVLWWCLLIVVVLLLVVGDVCVTLHMYVRGDFAIIYTTTAAGSIGTAETEGRIPVPVHHSQSVRKARAQHSSETV